VGEISLAHRLRRFWKKIRLGGLRQGLSSLQSALSAKPSLAFPLASADPDLILAASSEGIRDFVRRKGSGEKKVPANLHALFPREFAYEGRTMRYAFLPALGESFGLVVIFHGYLGFDIAHVNYGWSHFDLLLPLDNFGRKELGAWFWGENGDNFVERITRELILKVQGEARVTRWFAVGASMGGFAALYHAIKYEADGVYVMAPIINIEDKIRAYRARKIETSYTALAAANDLKLEKVPNIYQQAKLAKTLPPLFLVQNQYDRSNVFGDDTAPLLQIYNEKRGWTGLRVQPAIGHQGHDGSYAEANYFFNLIVKKSPPKTVDYVEET
jgi:hypothetical protein